jgi:hypothetical protein
LFGWWGYDSTADESCGDDLWSESGAAGIDGAVVGDGDEHDQHCGDVAGEWSGWRQQRDRHDFGGWFIYAAGGDSESEYFDDYCGDAGDARGFCFADGVDFESDPGGVIGAGDPDRDGWNELLDGCDG